MNSRNTSKAQLSNDKLRRHRKWWNGIRSYRLERHLIWRVGLRNLKQALMSEGELPAHRKRWVTLDLTWYLISDEWHQILPGTLSAMNDIRSYLVLYKRWMTSDLTWYLISAGSRMALAIMLSAVTVRQLSPTWVQHKKHTSQQWKNAAASPVWMKAPRHASHPLHCSGKVLMQAPRHASRPLHCSGEVLVFLGLL